MTIFRSLNLLSIALCFCVVVFGAYVRLSDAGLGCPDWPGCYGHLGVPDADHEVAAAAQRYPDRPVEAPKAWKEMIHRYLASTLGFLILVMAAMSRLKRYPTMPRKLPVVLLGLVIFQGVLGMWTVTWQLKPLVVSGHLLGGMTTLALLLWMWLGRRETEGLDRREPRSERQAAFLLAAPLLEPVGRQSFADGDRAANARVGKGLPTCNLKLFATLALVVLVTQIFLGGWTSTNYAALACPDFPTCHGRWLPETDVAEAYTLWRGLGINYEHGVLDNRARVTIHFFHRIGAILTTLIVGGLGLFLLLRGAMQRLRVLGAALLFALALQISIGIGTVLLQLPLLLAAAHNAGAAVLLLTLVSLNFFVWNPQAQ
ncbi:MAG: COX15/CtaA family protein [Panacagrimonas sp.]